MRVAAALLVLTAAAGCEVVPADEPGGSTTTTTPKDAGDATTKLGALKVAKAGSMSGYSREKFPHWRDTGSNCDIRDSVLKRDGSKVKVSGCNVVAGS